MPAANLSRQTTRQQDGTIYATRFKRMRESIEAMKEIWTKTETEYHGELVNFEGSAASCRCSRRKRRTPCCRS